jgi:hypothetical protein
MPGQILLVDDQPDMLLLLEMLITDKTSVAAGYYTQRLK